MPSNATHTWDQALLAKAYYSDDSVVLLHGDCLQITDWLAADVLCTDPPYGIAWSRNGISRTSRSQRAVGNYNGKQRGDAPIANDQNTTTRDAALQLWGQRPAIVFGSIMLPPPERTRHVAVYVKPIDTGVQASLAGLRRDIEAIYLLGKHPEWKRGSANPRTSVFRTNARVSGTPVGITARAGHPHAKALDVLEALITDVCPPGVIADPFAGSGSTLVAAKALGRKAIGVELEERYAEIAARRLAQDVLDFGGGVA